MAKLISSREEGRSGSKDRPGGGRQSGAGDTRGKSRDAVVGGRSSKTETKSSKLDQKSVKEDSKTAISKVCIELPHKFGINGCVHLLCRMVPSKE